MAEKNRYWTAIAYPENMVENWQNKIDHLTELPGVYCIHDKDTVFDDDEERKTHVHIIICFNNTTTGKHALNVFRKLNAEGKNAVPFCKPVLNIRYLYNYLIHDTDKAKQDGKFQYDKSERIGFNNFDIGSFEQLDSFRKIEIKMEIEDLIHKFDILNFDDLRTEVRRLSKEDISIYKVFTENQGYFANCVRGYYNKNYNYKMMEIIKENSDLRQQLRNKDYLKKLLEDMENEMEF